MKKYILLAVLLFLFLIPVNRAEAFSDVKTDDYFYEAVQWGQQQGIISGYNDGTFKPYNTVTHQQFIKMYTNTFNFYKKNPTTFADYYNTLKNYQMYFPFNAEYYYLDQSAESVKNGPIKRGDVALLLAFATGNIDKPDVFALDNYEEVNEVAAQYLLQQKISTAQNTKGKTAFDKIGGNNSLTRGQAITFLYRMYKENLTTLPNDVEAFRSPPTFTQKSEALRSYNMGNDIIYYVMKENEDLFIYITYKGYILAEHNTRIGAKYDGYTIGQKDFSPNEWYAGVSSAYDIEYYIDKHNNNIIRAVTKVYSHPAFHEIRVKMLSLNADSQLENVSYLYRDLANEFRTKNGVDPLEMNMTLTKAAKGHSVDMASRNYFDHNTPEGLSPSDRVQKLNDPEVYSAGENIAAGYSDIFTTHNGWINSLGHRNNLLREGYTHLGFAIAYNGQSKYGVYYTTNFATIYGEDFEW